MSFLVLSPGYSDTSQVIKLEMKELKRKAELLSARIARPRGKGLVSLSSIVSGTCHCSNLQPSIVWQVLSKCSPKLTLHSSENL